MNIKKQLIITASMLCASFIQAGEAKSNTPKQSDSPILVARDRYGASVSSAHTSDWSQFISSVFSFCSTEQDLRTGARPFAKR